MIDQVRGNAGFIFLFAALLLAAHLIIKYGFGKHGGIARHP